MAFTLPPIKTNKRTIARLLWLCLSFFLFNKVIGQKLISTKKNGNSTIEKTVSVERSNLLLLAKKNNWSISKNYTSDRVLRLQGIDIFGEPVYYTTHNVLALTGTKTSELQVGGHLGIELTGGSKELVGKIAIWDGGKVRPTHTEFGGRIKNETVEPFNDHATHLVGTILAKGSNPEAKGMAPASTISVYDYTDDIFEMNMAASDLLISNHAYGPVIGWVYNPTRPGTNKDLKWEWWGNINISATEDYRFGYYDDKARDLDKMAYINPQYLIVKSADNKRIENGPPAGIPYYLRDTDRTSTATRYANNAYDIIPPDATAKNILTVGSADISVSNGRLNGFGLSDFSGWGPTDDGRIKPDLLGVGRNIMSSTAVSDNSYTTYSGTSMAAANVSGALTLLQELYFKQKGTFMRSATLKGLVLHTASKPNEQTAPNYEYGWGLLDAQRAAQLLMNKDKSCYLLESNIAQGKNYKLKVKAAGGGPLVVSIAWTDPEAIPTIITTKTINDRTQKLINDLDIRISDEEQTFMPWVLDPANPKKAAINGDNFRDNVEQIYIPQAFESRTYTITVTHKGRLKNENQDFSLFVSGLKPQDCAAASKLISGSDTVLCGGGKMKLAISGGSGFSYELSKNGALVASSIDKPEWTVAEAGNYALRAVGFQCTGESKTVTIKTIEFNADITPKGSLTACLANPIKLSSNNGTGFTYQWLKDGNKIDNANGSTFDVVESGNYAIAITYNGCTAISGVTNVKALIQRPIISTNSGVDFANQSTIKLTTVAEMGVKYQWFFNDKTIPTATGPRFVATKPGKYTVSMSSSSCAILSKPIELLSANQVTQNESPIALSIKSFITNDSLRVYPNPATENLYVVYQSEDSYNLEVSIVNLYGITIKKGLLNDNGREFVAVFDITSLPSGSYIIRINDGIKSISELFIKQ